MTSATQRSGSWTAGTTALAVFVILAGIWLLLEREWANRLAYWESRLASTADHRADFASAWQAERHANAVSLAENPLTRLALGPDELRGALQPVLSVIEELTGFLEKYQEEYGYDGLHLTRRDGSDILQVGQPTSADVRDSLVQRALRTERLVQEAFRGTADSVYLATAFPVRDYSATSTGAEGVFILVMNLSSRLFPILLADATFTRTGETVLLEEASHASRVLSPLRLLPANDTVSQRPVPSQTVLGPLARAAQDTFGEYRDYRGARVIAASRVVPGVSWRVVRKIDYSEAFADVYRLQAIAAVTAVLVVLIATMILLTNRERRRALAAEREMERQQARLDALALADQIVSAVPSGIFLLDHEGRVLAANHAGLDLLDSPPDSVLGRPASELLADTPLSGLAQAFLESGTGRDRQEVRATQRGEPRTWCVDISRLPVEEGRSHVLIVVDDLTEQLTLAAQLHQAQRLEAIGRLAGGVAHDFNNLLTVIGATTELALDGLAPGEPLTSELRQIRDSTARAADLTRQLLAFGRRQAMQPQVVDPNTAMRNLEPLLARLIGSHVRLQLRLDPDAGRIRVDPTQLEQVIVNLAANGRDAMPDGGHLTIETAAVHLDEDYAASHPTTRPGPHVLIAVTDTGTGIAPDAQAHIFEPFFTTKESTRGTGLGLATVHGIVKQSGGNIWVYSEPGHGTTFKVYFPQVEGVAMPRATPPAGVRAVGGAETILVVEDNPDVRAVVVRVLRGFGYCILEAGDITTAVELFVHHRDEVALLLTDVVMPGAGGRQLASELVRLRPGLPVLFMSGYTANAIVHHGILDEGVAYIQKPFTVQQLATRVREMIDAAAGGPAADHA